MATSKKNTPKLFIIDDETLANPAIRDRVFAPIVDGEPKGHGLVPRDYSVYPPEMFAPPTDLPLIPKSEWAARIKDQEQSKSRLSDIRGDIKSLDQDGKGYCWAHSTTSCVMLLREINNQPRVRLSAYAIACVIKNYRDEGGWCGLSAKFWRERGCPTAQFWPEQSMSKSNDKPETWANAAFHKVTEDWVDLLRDIYDQNLTFDQLATCLLSGVPCAIDLNWWAHSICAMDLVEVEAGSFGVRIWNSWGDSWEDRGTAVLRGSKAVPNGAVALRVTGASPD